MALELFNSLGNKLQEFKPIKKGTVSLYTCGPTVYNYAHIGNFRAYVWEDILRRYLEYSGYKVKHIMNYTDVDDKTIKGSMAEKVPLDAFTAKYKKAFTADIASMNILPATKYTAATEYIEEMVNMVQTLLKKGYAYKGEDGSIYFSIKKFPTYGTLTGIDVKKLKAGARIKQDEYEKEGVGDFALWKAWDALDGAVYWETALGKGRPGWHIECSAMSTKELGTTFDIHTGGIDNKFPHHENEIAQAEGATGKKFVNYWLHCAHLMVNGEKMAKSKGNFFTLREILDKGYNPAAVRYVLLYAHYRQPINFTFESVKDATKTLEGLQNLIGRLQELVAMKKIVADDAVTDLARDAQEGFESAMDADLAVPEAVKYLFEFAKKINTLIDADALGAKGASEALTFLKKINTVLAVLSFEEKYIEPIENQEKLLEERALAKKNKNYKRADEIRAIFEKQHRKLIDNKDGSTSVALL